MNPRTFCREPGYSRCIALTYSFDPLFFERIILRDLWHGGTGDITVVGDQRELQEAIARCAGQFNYLGKKYLLTNADTRGAFHPKMVLRVGTEGARLLLGSGNLTFGGWGGNMELALNLDLKADQPGSSEIVNNLIDHIATYLTTASARESLARLRDYPWLLDRDEIFDHEILLTRPEEPLANQLLKRWSGRRFNRMVAFTGSTDEKGGFIDWCQKQFGVEECIVAVSLENSSFLQKEIEKLSSKVTLAPFIGAHRLHAKFYWFDGPDGPAAVVGSANCSYAAWLLAPISGGNVEAIHAYDSPDKEDFKAVLDLLPKKRKPIDKVDNPKKEEDDQKEKSPYHLKEIILQRGLGFIEAKINQNPAENAIVTLIAPGDISIPLDLRTDSLWWGGVPETIIWPDYPTLASVCIEMDDETYHTPLHWVDDLDSINRASQAEHKMPSFGGPNYPRTSSEHAKVVSDLALISSSLFSDSASYNDPQLRRREHAEKGGQQRAEPVKPEDLIKSLNDLNIKEAGQNGSLGPGMHLSMFGVMRALFEEADSTSDDAIIEDEAKTIREDMAGAGDEPEKENPPQGNDNDREPPPDRYRERLRKQLGIFFENFSSLTFEKECTATKLVQAAAYPLTIAMFGERGQWLTHEESRDCITRVVDILLIRECFISKSHGLLNAVGERYKNKGQYDVFMQIVGDGTLWVALLAALAQSTWEKGIDQFTRAVNLYRVYNCDVLRSDTSVGKLGALVTRIQVNEARDLIANEAPEIVRVIENIEVVLRDNYNNLIEKKVTYKTDDLIWNPKAGWGIVKTPSTGSSMRAYLHLRGEEKKVSTKNYYVNIRLVAEDYPIIKESLRFIVGKS